MYFVQCTLYTIHYTMLLYIYNVLCTMYIVQCTLYTIHYTMLLYMYNVLCTMYFVHYTLYNVVISIITLYIMLCIACSNTYFPGYCNADTSSSGFEYHCVPVEPNNLGVVGDCMLVISPECLALVCPLTGAPLRKWPYFILNGTFTEDINLYYLYHAYCILYNVQCI